MTAPPLVSVIIPAHNAAHWIGQTLESVQAQTLREIEILVVDDGSIDASAEVVAGYAGGDPRIQLLRQENAGVGAARNTGIRAARGEFIAPLDADDLWAPEKLEKQVRRCNEWGGRTGFVYCWSRVVDAQGREIGAKPWCSPEGNLRKALILQNLLSSASIPLFRTEALRQVGPYLTRKEQGGAQGCEDWDMSLRVAEQWDVAVVPEFLVAYRRHSASMSSCTEGMVASHRIAMARVRQRNRDLPRALFRWSGGYFYKYIADTNYRNGRYGLCLASLGRALWADPVMVLNSQVTSTAFNCVLNLVADKREPPTFALASPIRPFSPRPYSIFPRIQKRRWNAALSKRP